MCFICESICYYFYFLAPTGPPTNFTATALDTRTIYITWKPPLYPEQNGLLTYYNVTYGGVERDTITRVEIFTQFNRSNTSLTVTDLEEATTFTISIQASTMTGPGPVTWIIVTTPEDGEYI